MIMGTVRRNRDSWRSYNRRAAGADWDGSPTMTNAMQIIKRFARRQFCLLDLSDSPGLMTRICPDRRVSELTGGWVGFALVVRILVSGFIGAVRTVIDLRCEASGRWP